ncbi:MAG: 50S ribosomal protein L25/general stress protein Ctc [Bacteroidetes bacterium]|nr:50S ribosomal protein L25/general stress protein Ctc [Bacteroidota bacterium]
MKTVSLSGSLRGNVGKKDAKAGRSQGNVPCVLYGGKEQIHFMVKEKDFRKIIFSPEVCILQIKLGEKSIDAILQDVQYHPVTDRVLHVDFLEILPGKPVNIAIPVKITGTAPGVLKGGRLISKLRKLKVKALAEHLPDHITISIGTLEVGDSVRISDLSIEHLHFMDSPHAVVIGVRTARAVVEEEKPAEEAATEGGEEKAEGGADKKEGGKKE